jgi:hypothetical protein
MTDRTVMTACFCQGKPHDKDRCVLAPELPPRAGIAAASAMYAAGEHGDLAGALVEAILVNGAIKSWNLVEPDDKGENQPLPVTPDNVAKRVTWNHGAQELSNAIFDQFVTGKSGFFGSATSPRKNGKPSPPGPTGTSTSRRMRSSPSPVPSE